jgi:hypothetical protein
MIIVDVSRPEIAGQANVDPATAVQVYREYIPAVRALGYRISLPSITGSPEGYSWLKEYVQKCSGCVVRFKLSTVSWSVPDEQL